ncbi:MAG: TraR/DksA family transcriptional regulator [Candidatus Aminicenantes bacterium]|nr:MAG: TraR/DksA family transcriptional regulator [Candidatus Aminicenantes bacterium]TET74574.1 MAG: TraR/DksA family transcriptional regulator [Candidatus Aminicenantes bacterium]
MNKREKERYKKKLLEKKKEINHHLSEFYTESKEVETGIAQDVVDRAESSYTKEFLLSLSNKERKQLSLINEALKRIEKGTYGICQRCTQEIGKKRLEAIPWTPYCINCQEKEEEESS